MRNISLYANTKDQLNFKKRVLSKVHVKVVNWFCNTARI